MVYIPQPTHYIPQPIPHIPQPTAYSLHHHSNSVITHRCRHYLLDTFERDMAAASANGDVRRYQGEGGVFVKNIVAIRACESSRRHLGSLHTIPLRDALRHTIYCTRLACRTGNKSRPRPRCTAYRPRWWGFTYASSLNFIWIALTP